VQRKHRSDSSRPLRVGFYEIRRLFNLFEVRLRDTRDFRTGRHKYRTPDVEEFRMNLYEAKNPLLGKGGVDAPSKNIPVLLKGADGVVRSTSE